MADAALTKAILAKSEKIARDLQAAERQRRDLQHLAELDGDDLADLLLPTPTTEHRR